MIFNVVIVLFLSAGPQIFVTQNVFQSEESCIAATHELAVEIPTKMEGVRHVIYDCSPFVQYRM